MRELPRTGLRGAHDRVDPDYAPTVEIFDNLTHDQIHAGVSLLNPSVLQTGRQLWQGAATGLNDAVAEAHTEIRGAIADGWRGAAAGMAGAAVRDFEAAGRQLADVLATVAGRLGQAGDAAETLRAGVAEPSGAEPDLAAALLDPHAATGNIAAQRAADDERADAVRVMESVYTGAFIPTGAQVPAFPGLSDQQSGPSGAPAAPAAPGATTPGPNMPVGQTVSFATPEAVTAPAGEQSPGPAKDDPDRPGVPVVAGTPSPAAAAPAPVDQPQATTTAGTELPASAPTAPATVPSAAGPPVAPATASGGPVFAAPVRPAASSADDDRKRQEQQHHSSGEAITGMGAGAIGGMMGGAMAADTVRSGAPVAPVRVERSTDEDDELHFADEDLTFLEPSDAGGQLIGALDPTTPPVLGEWTEAE
ncbi:hypothetical protein [Nocardia sp. NPDC051750]|uniref:PPE domain-containing protein n=1 Tax=Nocardia sp. NPDC051750 TaxID=3364325 RepID=UPI0037A9DDF2